MKLSSVPWGMAAALTSEILGRGGLMVFQWAVARELGPSAFGTLGLILASVAIFSPLADLGTQSLTLRLASQDPGALPGLIALRLGGLFLLAIGACLLAPLLTDAPVLALLLAAAYYGVLSTTDFLRQVFRARELPRAELAARLWWPVGLLVSLMVLYLERPGMLGILTLYIVAPGLLLLAYCVMLAHRELLPRPDFVQGRILLIRHAGLLAPSTLFILTTIVASRLDLWILDGGAPREDVGRWFAAWNTVMALSFIGQALASHMFPRLQRGDRGRPIALFRAFLAHFLTGSTLGLGVVVAGPPVFSLIFGPDFAPATSLLAPFGVILAFSILNHLWFALFTERDRMGLFALLVAGSTLFRWPLGSQLLHDHGPIGLAWGIVALELVLSLVAGLIASRLYLRASAPKG